MAGKPLLTDRRQAIPVQVGTVSSPPTAGAPGVELSLGLSPQSLAFQKAQGRHVDRVEMIGALFGPGGKFVTGEEALLDMDISKETLANLIRSGLHITVTLRAPRGHYLLRFVLEDGGSGKLFATTLPAAVP